MAPNKDLSCSFRFRGRSFMALVIKPQMPIRRWLAEVDTWLSRSPDFFARKSVVLDVSGLALTKRKLLQLIGDLNARSVRILGLEGADPSWIDECLPPLMTGAGATADVTEVTPPQQTAAQAPSPSLLVELPVRSGQSILYDGDVTVVGSVASGAEIIAAGSVHVYGPLRGRVFAGASGNPQARIFCRRLEAELIAIDGYYWTADELEPQLRNKPIHACLEDGALKLSTLD